MLWMAYGICLIVTGSAGINAGLCIARLKQYMFCCAAIVMMWSIEVFSLAQQEMSISLYAAYALVLTIPATAMFLLAKDAFEDVGAGHLVGLGPMPPPMWPQPPPASQTAPSPAPPMAPPAMVPADGAPIFTAVPPPPAPPGWPPPYPYPNPPRPLYFKDVGRARAVRAGFWMTVSAEVLVFFGIWGIIWPVDYPGFGLGIIALVGSVLGLAGAYLALLRAQKGPALGMAAYVLVSLFLFTISGFIVDGAVGIIFLPLLVLGSVAFGSTMSAYRPVAPPYPPPPPLQFAPPPLNVR